jgi:N4-gp56 family major capsid protein
LQALTEDSDTVLTPSYISATDVTGTVVQYGHGVLFSDFLLLTSRFDLVNEALEQLGMDAGLWVDSYTVNNAIKGNGFAMIAGADGTSVTYSVTASTTLTIDDINYAGTKMGKLKTKRFRTGTWAGIGDHAQLHHVKASIAADGQSTQTWMELNKYTGDNIRELKSWMIGRIANIDIYEAHNGTSVGSTDALSDQLSLVTGTATNPFPIRIDSVDNYVFRVVSPGAYGSVDLEGGSVATYVKKLGSAGWKDLINQRAGVGIKIFYGVKNLAMASRCVEIYSGFNGIGLDD